MGWFGNSKAKQEHNQRQEQFRRKFAADVRAAERKLDKFERSTRNQVLSDRAGDRSVRQDLQADLAIARANLRGAQRGR